MISFEQPIVRLYCNCHAKVDHAGSWESCRVSESDARRHADSMLLLVLVRAAQGCLYVGFLLAQATRAFGRSNQEAIALATSDSGTGWRDRMSHSAPSQGLVSLLLSSFPSLLLCWLRTSFRRGKEARVFSRSIFMRRSQNIGTRPSSPKNLSALSALPNTFVPYILQAEALVRWRRACIAKSPGSAAGELAHPSYQCGERKAARKVSRKKATTI